MMYNCKDPKCNDSGQVVKQVRAGVALFVNAIFQLKCNSAHTVLSLCHCLLTRSQQYRLPDPTAEHYILQSARSRLP